MNTRYRSCSSSLLKSSELERARDTPSRVSTLPRKSRTGHFVSSPIQFELEDELAPIFDSKFRKSEQLETKLQAHEVGYLFLISKVLEQSSFLRLYRSPLGSCWIYIFPGYIPKECAVSLWRFLIKRMFAAVWSPRLLLTPALSIERSSSRCFLPCPTQRAIQTEHKEMKAWNVPTRNSSGI